jgi:hypothetical protein
MNRIPAEAREALMRAWLEILRERHPDVTFELRPLLGRESDFQQFGPWFLASLPWRFGGQAWKP